MKAGKQFLISAAVLLSLIQFGACTTPYISASVQYSNPAWAPSYYAGTRYYYLPDIETYYDLSDQDFVYLDNGQWLFSASLPAMYSNYDLYSGFAVSLNNSVFQPWMHHHLYVSNYPRYYYRNMYNGSNGRTARGFNENQRAPVYSQPGQNNHTNPMQHNENNGRSPAASRPPQNTHYYGRNIGQPVKVQRQMRESKPGGNNQGHH